MYFTDVLLALSLAVDAFVASLAIGLKQQQLAKYWFIVIPLTFGGFQAAMPWLGWQLVTTLTSTWLDSVDHWIAFILLGLVGGNMLRQVLSKNDQGARDTQSDARAGAQRFSVTMLLSLAVATSIDALAVGVTLPSISAYPVQTIISIGVITAMVCSIGLLGTRYIPKFVARPAEIVAGVVLIGLGCKILLFS